VRMNNIDLRFITSEDLKIVQEIIVAATEGIIVSAEKENEFAAKIADWRRRYACEAAGVCGSDPSFIKSLIWYNTDKVDRTWREYANSLEKEIANNAAQEVLEKSYGRGIGLGSEKSIKSKERYREY